MFRGHQCVKFIKLSENNLIKVTKYPNRDILGLIFEMQGRPNFHHDDLQTSINRNQQSNCHSGPNYLKSFMNIQKISDLIEPH